MISIIFAYLDFWDPERIPWKIATERRHLLKLKKGRNQGGAENAVSLEVLLAFQKGAGLHHPTSSLIVKFLPPNLVNLGDQRLKGFLCLVRLHLHVGLGKSNCRKMTSPTESEWCWFGYVYPKVS